MRDRSQCNFVLRPSSSSLIDVWRLRVTQGCPNEIARDRARPTKKVARGNEGKKGDRAPRKIEKGGADLGMNEEADVASVLERESREGERKVEEEEGSEEKDEWRRSGRERIKWMPGG